MKGNKWWGRQFKKAYKQAWRAEVARNAPPEHRKLLITILHWIFTIGFMIFSASLSEPVLTVLFVVAVIHLGMTIIKAIKKFINALRNGNREKIIKKSVKPLDKYFNL